MENQNNTQSIARGNYIKIIEQQAILANRYTDIKRIDNLAGEGCFSLVFTAQDVVLDKRVVLKFFDPSAYSDPQRLAYFSRESSILKDLQRQKNILPLIQEKTDVDLEIVPKSGLTFPFTFYSAQLASFSIAKYIYTSGEDYYTNMIYLREMCKAVQRIHNKTICHRDIKPSNFLVYKKRYVCLSDFGTARYFGNKYVPIHATYGHPVGTLLYIAPELLWGGLHFSEKHNYCGDIYSLGAILFELFTKTPLNLNIYRTVNQDDLYAHFRIVPENRRIVVFDGLIDDFARSTDLPSIRMFNPSIPKPIAQEVDILYRRMANLDYRKREANFDRIFLRINICLKVIQIQSR